MYDYRRAKRLANGFIDCEIDHPKYGWIPITLDPSDPSPELVGLFEQIVANGDAAAYVPTPVQVLKDRAIERAIEQIDAERDRLRYIPISYGGTLFDTDGDSQALISGTLSRLTRGDGLPIPWVGWRDHANTLHWASDDAATVSANLRGLAGCIENREAAIRVTSWQKKSEVIALETVIAIQSYPVLSGWPA